MKIATVAHLVRRWVGSFDRRPIDSARLEAVASVLSPDEYALWQSMRIEDRRHSLIVFDRYRASRPNGSRAEFAGVLLHDVGKLAANLGTVGRIVATLVGARGVRFRAYHDHEVLGAVMAARVHADPLTVAMIQGDGPEDLTSALVRADNY